jgi:hypothetical protein
MATSPIFAGAPKSQSNATNTLTANTAVDGTGTLTTFFTCGASGSFVDAIYVRPRGTNVATVMRFFRDGNLFEEVTCPITTVSQVAALAPLVIPIRKPFSPNTVLTYTIGTTVASGFTVTGFGGDY